MSRAEGRGYFRGSEFSRLLVLAGLVLFGWPLVVYYGFVARPRQKPAPAPIASLPKMPPPDASPALAGVLDANPDEPRPRTFRDDVPMAYLLKKVREDSPPGLSTIARRELLPADFLLTPRRYRGIPVRMEGFAEQVFAHDDEDRELAPAGRLYEVWFRSEEHDQRIYPCSLWMEAVPPTLPGGRGLEERVAFEGYFYRLIGYRAGDRGRFAPMLVGRLSHEPSEAAGGRVGSRSRFWTFLPLVLLLVYLSLRMTFSLRKTIRRPPSGASISVNDRIEPEELDRWLQEPQAEE